VGGDADVPTASEVTTLNRWTRRTLIWRWSTSGT